MNVHPNKIQNVIFLTKEARYDYFLRKIADSMCLWGLFKEGWATSKGSSILIPFWPEECFANICATDEWGGLSAECIDTEKFLNAWIPGMERDKRKCLIFPTPTDDGLIKSPQALKLDLINEIGQYK